MSTICTTNCVYDTRVPMRATYVNLYKWPESDAEFVKAHVCRPGRKGHDDLTSFSPCSGLPPAACPEFQTQRWQLNTRVGMANMRGGAGLQPRVVDSVSCRQMYLRSYTFSKKESVTERIKKCFGEFIGKNKGKIRPRRARCMVRMKEMSCAALSAIFHKMLSCTATLDVVDH